MPLLHILMGAFVLPVFVFTVNIFGTGRDVIQIVGKIECDRSVSARAVPVVNNFPQVCKALVLRVVIRVEIGRNRSRASVRIGHGHFKRFPAPYRLPKVDQPVNLDLLRRVRAVIARVDALAVLRPADKCKLHLRLLAVGFHLAARALRRVDLHRRVNAALLPLLPFAAGIKRLTKALFCVLEHVVLPKRRLACAFGLSPRQEGGQLAVNARHRAPVSLVKQLLRQRAVLVTNQALRRLGHQFALRVLRRQVNAVFLILGNKIIHVLLHGVRVPVIGRRQNGIVVCVVAAARLGEVRQLVQNRHAHLLAGANARAHQHAPVLPVVDRAHAVRQLGHNQLNACLFVEQAGQLLRYRVLRAVARVLRNAGQHVRLSKARLLTGGKTGPARGAHQVHNVRLRV